MLIHRPDAFQLTLRAGRSRGEFLRELGQGIGPGAMKLLSSEKMPFVEAEKSELCVVVTPHSLGFKGSVARADLYDSASRVGLKEVHPQAGPEFAINWWRPDAPPGENVRIGMSPISYFEGSSSIFEVRREQAPFGVASVRLGIDAGDSVVVFDVFSEWLFAIA